MKIKGSVFEEIGRVQPYCTSRQITICDLELDDPQPGEVLIRIEAAGICHSDLSVVNVARVRHVPMLFVHEVAERIKRLGEGIDDLVVGRRVATPASRRTGPPAERFAVSYR